MKVVSLVAVMMLSSLLMAQEAPVRQSKDTTTPDQMRSEVKAKADRINEIEQSVQKMTAEASKEKDLKWKLCLDDIFASVRGISASVLSAKGRMDDLIRADKVEAARTQAMLVRGLADAAEKSFAESQACPRQLTRVDNRSTVEREEDKKLTGTHGENGSIGDAMGQNFADGWATERDPNDLNTEDPIDGAGTDNTGGPTETPGDTGGDAGSIVDNGDLISEPPFVEPSPEK